MLIVGFQLGRSGFGADLGLAAGRRRADLQLAIEGKSRLVTGNSRGKGRFVTGTRGKSRLVSSSSKGKGRLVIGSGEGTADW